MVWRYRSTDSELQRQMGWTAQSPDYFTSTPSGSSALNRRLDEIQNGLTKKSVIKK
jgi:hypothetical protein